MRTHYTVVLVAALACGGVASPQEAVAQREARQDRASRESQGDYAAYKLMQRAQQLLDAGEKDRGVKMFETVIEEYPRSPIRFQAYLALGRQYIDTRDYAAAIDHLRNIEQLQGQEELRGEDRDRYLESLYLRGLARFHQREYAPAFSVLRKITNNYPDSTWANKAYYYIGMSHFAQSNWDKAIKALSRVGTFIDPESPTLAYAEAGHRFHVRVADGDLPVLEQMGREVTVTATTAAGDEETILCGPSGSRRDVFTGSILTDPGEPSSGDGTLQIVGGDRITVRYLDDNTLEGEKDVPREKSVEVVSSGGLTFTLGTFDSLAPAAYLGQPLFLRLWDLDRDTGEDRNTVTLRVASLYKAEQEAFDDAEPDDPTTEIDIEELLNGGEIDTDEEEKEQLTVRDQVEVTLTERGEQPVRTGVFIGSVPVEQALATAAIDRTDDRLAAEVGDRIVATYVDERHIGGQVPLDVTVELVVAGEVDAMPRAAQDVVPDPVIRAKKQLVEAEAYLELARIFRDMGLMRGAHSKAAAGLTRVEDVIRASAELPSDLKQQAFHLKWDLHLADNDFRNAMATCSTFNRLYPESPLVDRALMGIAEALETKGDVEGATKVWRQVTKLDSSHAKAEAQFRIAQALDMGDNRAKAIQEYNLCAQRYPDSEYAGKALAEVIVYHTKSGAYDVADDLLEQIFIDYQDEDFLDEMLYRWIIVAFQSGDYAKARSKYQQLISEYPGSAAARRVEAQGTLADIENAMKIQKEKSNDR